MRLHSSVLAGAAALVAASAQAGNAQDTIDRPLTIYVAGTAGGGIDLYARLVARHIGRHIPGKPTVTVQLMPGAGGIRAANYLAEQAPRDGTVMTTFAGGPILEPLIGARNPGYDMTYCCGILVRDGLVMFADTRTNAGVDNIATFRKLHVLVQPGRRIMSTSMTRPSSVTILVSS